MSGRNLATPKSAATPANTRMPAPNSGGRRSPCTDSHSYKSEGSRDSSHTAISGVSSQGFRIGDRIYVGGTRSGTVCFIGKTKFADGEWAGINLDDATGKNDGSVGGVRYFQCPMSHGLFSRLTNLSFEKRSESADAGGAAEQQLAQLKSSPRGGSVSSAKSESAPTARATAAAAGASVTEAASEASVEDCPLKVGMRVIVGGTRPGTLRFVGPANFAKGKGLFAGVELDEPTGKNDGSVESERYFTCKPRYGLFAPVHRVLPLHVDEAPGLAPVGVGAGGIAALSHSAASAASAGANRNRYGSQESVSSAGSVSRQHPRTRLGIMSLSNHAASAAVPASASGRQGSVSSPTETLKKVVQEKSEHIEQLLREREQERSEVARALAAAEEAEIGRISAERALTELRERLDSRESALAASERERDELRERLEDLQFSMAESMVGEEEGGALPGAGGDADLLKSESVAAAAAATASELAALLERVSNLEMRLAEREAELNRTRAEAAQQLESAAADAARQLAEAKSVAAERLTNAANEAAAVKADLEKKFSAANLALEAAKAKEDELSSRVESLSSANLGLTVENDRLTTDLMQSESAAAVARSELDAVSKERDDLLNRCSDLQSRLDQSAARINDLLESAAAAPPPPPPQALVPEPQPEYRQLQQQLEFLNSVIVDLKAKNSKLERDVVLLSAIPDTPNSAFASSDSAYQTNSNAPIFAKPPRPYCDICEEFDLHETEDCPVQGGGGRSESPRPTTRRLADPTGGEGGGATRPYCNICEVFGHSTADCNQDETY